MALVEQSQLLTVRWKPFFSPTLSLEPDGRVSDAIFLLICFLRPKELDWALETVGKKRR